jgi:hypothetical protein
MMMRRYGFRHFTAVTDFLRGKSMLDDKCDSEVAKLHGEDPIELFTRVTQVDPENPYGYAYLLFAMEDTGGYTIKQLADVSSKWSDAAIAYGLQGQPEFAMMTFSKYMRMIRGI